jgi:hypothetical protein
VDLTYVICTSPESLAPQQSPDSALQWEADARIRTGDPFKLQLVATFWLGHSITSKATMHGYGMVARRYLNEPPGAGALSANLTSQPSGLFAAALVSRFQGDPGQKVVETTPHYAELGPESIELLDKTALAAQNLLWGLRSAQLARLARDVDWHLHGAYLDLLPADQQGVLREMGRSS